MKSQWNPKIFREYDIRGLAGKDLSADFSYHLGLAYGVLTHKTLPTGGRKKFTVSVGRDCRLSSDEYAEAMIRGLRAANIDVIDLGTCPTPLSYFSVFHLNLDGSVMITGSHNPAEYNGFKICWGRSTIHGETIQELRKILDSGVSPKNEQGALTHYEIIPAYISDVRSKFPPAPLKKLKIVADAGNGTASTVIPALLKALGAEVFPLYCELDGRFPNHHPDPTVPSNLTALVKKIKEVGADLGVAFDGDSDRLGLVDERGNILFGDEILVLLSRSVLKENRGATIISEVKSSNRLYKDISDHGGVPIMWKTGHSLIKSKMKETGALLAGEMSGHIFFADRYFGYDDALYAAARVYEILSNENKPLSQLLSDLPKSFSTPEIRIDCMEDLKFPLVNEVSKKLRTPLAKVTDIDGIRVDWEDGWGLLRASNTQPVLVMRFEAQSQARLEQLQNHFEAAVSAAATAVGHPEIDFSAPAAH
jgi:phosphomannomutase/phosphoglucomutase